MPTKVIARVMGIWKTRCGRRCAPKYDRPLRGSVVEAVEPRIRELLQAGPTMPATVIAERIGWHRSIRVLRDRVAELRPVYLPPNPASRTVYVVGGIARFDLWFSADQSAGRLRPGETDARSCDYSCRPSIVYSSKTCCNRLTTPSLVNVVYPGQGAFSSTIGVDQRRQDQIAGDRFKSYRGSKSQGQVVVGH
jgi:hypothetical protein